MQTLDLKGKCGVGVDFESDSCDIRGLSGKYSAILNISRTGRVNLM